MKTQIIRQNVWHSLNQAKGKPAKESVKLLQKLYMQEIQNLESIIDKAQRINFSDEGQKSALVWMTDFMDKANYEPMDIIMKVYNMNFVHHDIEGNRVKLREMAEQLDQENKTYFWWKRPRVLENVEKLMGVVGCQSLASE